MADESPGEGVRTTPMERLLRDKDARVLKLERRARDLAQKLAAAEQAREAAVRDSAAAVDAAKKQYDTAALKAENERLRADMRDRDHRAAFERVALEKGAHPDAIPLLYKTSGYKAEADQPDPEAMGMLLDGIKDQPGVALLFGGPGQAPTPGPPPPPPGSGQGGRDRSAGKWRVSREQYADGKWAMENAKALQQAIAEGRLELYESR